MDVLLQKSKMSINEHYSISTNEWYVQERFFLGGATLGYVHMTLYTPNVKYGDDNLTCAYLNGAITRSHVLYKGSCGEMVGGNFEERCHDELCKASKEVCESKGYTFQPYTELHIQSQNAYIASIGLLKVL